MEWIQWHILLFNMSFFSLFLKHFNDHVYGNKTLPVSIMNDTLLDFSDISIWLTSWVIIKWKRHDRCEFMSFFLNIRDVQSVEPPKNFRCGMYISLRDMYFLTFMAHLMLSRENETMAMVYKTLMFTEFHF